MDTGNYLTIKRDPLGQFSTINNNVFHNKYLIPVFHVLPSWVEGCWTFPCVKIVGVAVVNGPGARGTAPN
jgi:hypothetical protein